MEYVFHDPSGKKLPLEDREFGQFERIHSKPSRNGNDDPDGTWKVIKPTLDAGEPIPVFYVGEPESARSNVNAPFAFGLTRLFKVPHEYSVGDVIARQGPHGRPVEVRPADRSGAGNHAPIVKCDFVEKLFGFVHERGGEYPDFAYDGDGEAPRSIARKGRIAFSFGCFTDPTNLESTDPIETIMMGPRGSFAPFYLRGEYKDYGSDTARISGRKRYLPRFAGGALASASAAIGRALSAQLANAPPSVRSNTRLQSRLRFLVRWDGGATRFSSTIRIHNVGAEEIGAVLWALTHGGDAAKPFRHMLGRAKAFGAGQIRVMNARLKLRPNSGESELIGTPEKMEVPGDGREGFCPAPAGEPATLNASHKPFLQAFEAFMQGQIGEQLKETAQISEFLSLSDPEIGAALARDGRLEYLSDVQDFQTVRRMTQLLIDGSPPRYPTDWGGRYLETRWRKPRSR